MLYFTVHCRVLVLLLWKHCGGRHHGTQIVLLLSLHLEVFLSPQEMEENRKDPLIHPGQLLEPVTLRGDGMGNDPIHHLQCCQRDSHMLLQKQEKIFPEGKQELLLLQPWRQLKNQLAYGTLYWGGPWVQGGIGYIWELSHFRSIIISMQSPFND